ncbi:hypothetical protein TanjilG_16702 [Lupinus angustifolius]|uniref:Pre-mRNA cleavage factor Im 25 kDa subunit n=1 Tax=Lupinus angustifolius TaxID=3871 RepID=A0A4P1QZS7_LUPAN|nr:hypothetical protein TanjilG_16702 [Lupinus angustifolius]
MKVWLDQVELFKHPHLLLLQVRNSTFKLPGGRLRPGESDINGLKRKLTRNLSENEDGNGTQWEVSGCLGMWWRPDFEASLYPYLPPNVKQPKECTKLFLVKLPVSRKFIVPKNLRLLAVPLCQIQDNDKVELFKHPHLLLLQVRNSTFKLPGGRLRPGESDINGLKRKLTRNLSENEDGNGTQWEVSGCLGMWWRPDFEASLYPYLPPNVKQPKECTKLFLVKLPVSRKFIVPKNLRLLAVPLCQIQDNDKTYGPIISGVPHLLSKFSFNMIES